MSLITDPSTLSPSAWFSTTGLTGVDGAAVSSWTDLSTGGRTLVQASSTAQPKAYLDMLNGYRGILFDGSDDYLATSTGSSGLMSAILGTDGVGTSIVVFANTSTGSTGGLWGANANNASQLYLSLDAVPPLVAAMAGSVAPAIPAEITPPLDIGMYSGSTDMRAHVALWQHTTSGTMGVGIDNLDTTAIESGVAEAASAGLTANLLVGQAIGTAGASRGFFKGYLYELLYFPTLLTESQRRGVYLYLANKYAISYGGGLADEGAVLTSLKVEMKLPTSTLQITPSAWYKADAIVGLNDGDAVSTWSDSSANGYDITAALTVRPTYQTNEINGLPAILFDGSNDMLAGTVTLAQLFKEYGRGTVYVVAKPMTAAGAHDHLIWSGAGAGTPTRMTVVEDGAAAGVLHAYNYDGSEDDAAKAATLGAWNVLVWEHHTDSSIYAGVDHFDWTDMAETASGNTADLANVLNVGGQATLGDYFKGYIAEILFFYGSHTQAQRRHVHSCLAAKYDLTYTYDGSSTYEPMFVDVTSDLRGEDGLSFRYGMDGASVTDRVASSGVARFSMENSPANSAGIAGYYSPNNASKRSGFDLGVGVRISFLYYGTRYYKWAGKIASLGVIPGKTNHVVRVQATDLIEELAKTMVGYGYLKPSVRVNYTAAALFAYAVPYFMVTIPPLVIARSSDIYPYALDNTKDEDTMMLDECQRIAMSELGYIYVRGNTNGAGELVFESRGSRAARTAVCWAMIDTDIIDLSLNHNTDDMINRVLVTIHPRRVDDQATVLFSLSNTPQIRAGETYTIDAAYRDPNNDRHARVGGINMITPASTTDYTFSSTTSGANNLVTQLTVTPAFGANSAFVTMTNSTAGDGYLTKLQLRGYGLYSFETFVVDIGDSTSIDDYGQLTSRIDMPYQQDLFLPKAVATFLVTNNKSPNTKIKRVTFLPNISSAAMIQALAREPGDRISITESVSGLNAVEYFIQGIEFEVRAGGLVRVSWALMPTSMETALA